ncbi:carcinine hydrolase/isopenicillin-N N-acyltransferase family protein [Hwanghaeella sp.]|uniref:carcinine hydrolase/isopenicillin-N N-acyltransferase family protein n=1 Tax=Hwanghaeella sp. TaxID=2605943 RepID=UPI003CCBD681
MTQNPAVSTATAATGFPKIPVHDIGTAPLSVLVDLEPDRMAEILASGRRHLGALPLRILDSRSEKWARRSGNPYQSEVRAIAEGRPRGLWFMNFCYEWGCTTGAETPPGKQAPLLRRTLDWPFDEIGRNMVLVRQEGTMGPVLYPTWPGYLGAISGMAPGRFAIMINQAPLPKTTGILPFDWVSARIATRRMAALPPAHLLRHVFETCADFSEAVDRLTNTPIALPVIFTIAGTKPGETLTIERQRTGARIDRETAVAANHWRLYEDPARPRGKASPDRARQMVESWADHKEKFGWLTPPILNKDTRLALECDMASGTMHVIGCEKDGIVTDITSIQ